MSRTSARLACGRCRGFDARAATINRAGNRLVRMIRRLLSSCCRVALVLAPIGCAQDVHAQSDPALMVSFGAGVANLDEEDTEAPLESASVQALFARHFVIEA